MASPTGNLLAKAAAPGKLNVPDIVGRVLILYLAVYYLLVAGAVATAWKSGLIEHFSVDWAIASVAVAIGLGVLLAMLSRR